MSKNKFARQSSQANLASANVHSSLQGVQSPFTHTLGASLTLAVTSHCGGLAGTSQENFRHAGHGSANPPKLGPIMAWACFCVHVLNSA